MRHTQIVSSAVLLALALAPAAHGHGFMFEPAARNVLTDYEYCPQCLNAGGPWEVSAQGTLVWPAGVHGTCGDPGTGGPNDTPGAVAATYAAGSVITLSLLITARHGGRHEFRVCDRANADEACLSVHTLQRWAHTCPVAQPCPLMLRSRMNRAVTKTPAAVCAGLMVGDHTSG